MMAEPIDHHDEPAPPPPGAGWEPPQRAWSHEDHAAHDAEAMALEELDWRRREFPTAQDLGEA